MKRSNIPLQSKILVAGATAIGIAYALLIRPPNRDSEDKVVIITGGSRGLGLALAERYGRTGAKLVLAARNPDELASARSILLQRKTIRSADDVLLVPADLTDPAQAASLIEQAIARFGHIDILINDAGIIQGGPFENQPLSTFRQAMDTNFFAALHTIQAAVPHMLQRRESTGRQSSIVNITSIGGKFAMPHLLPYVASKFAFVGFSEGLHAELRHKGIRVTTVCPGLMRTGSHVQAEFVGNRQKEFRWFALSATTPGVATSAKHAANRIYSAVAAGCAEITITPQAWLAARMVGIAPATTQYLASLANEYVLPSPSIGDQPVKGFDVPHSTSARVRKLQEKYNQQPPSDQQLPYEA
jgi:NAD(P)-dependent dehydrogenase (short-subunit alcohol dehydrogenase family)